MSIASDLPNTLRATATARAESSSTLAPSRPSRRAWSDTAITHDREGLNLTDGERFLRLAKILIAEPREKPYYRFCGYGNYENIRLSLYPVVSLPRSLGFIGFCL